MSESLVDSGISLDWEPKGRPIVRLPGYVGRNKDVVPLLRWTTGEHREKLTTDEEDLFESDRLNSLVNNKPVVNLPEWGNNWLDPPAHGLSKEERLLAPLKGHGLGYGLSQYPSFFSDCLEQPKPVVSSSLEDDHLVDVVLPTAISGDAVDEPVARTGDVVECPPEPRQEDANPRPSSTRVNLGFRLRRRGKWTNQVSSILDQSKQPVVGGWTSHWLASAWLGKLDSYRGAKLGKGQRVVVGSVAKGDEREDVTDWLVEISNNGSSMMVSIGLLAKLSTFTAYKTRDSLLLQVLRSRAVQAGKELSFPTEYVALVLTGTVAMAHHVGPDEEAAWHSLAGAPGRSTDITSGQYAKEVVKSVDVRTGLPTDHPSAWFSRLFVAGRTIRGRSLRAPAA